MEKEKVNYSQESVLIVDDEDQIRETLEKLLEAIGLKNSSVSSGSEALEVLKDGKYTFLLSDMRMTGMDGLELIKKATEEFPDLSIIAMTGYSGRYKYIDVIDAGASDFIKKPFEADELDAKISRIIAERELRKELNWLSITDSLTGLYNQRQFYTRLQEEIIRAKRQKHPLSLIFLDLDHFKAYNDTYGHLAGDEVLRNVGNIINRSIRDGVDSGYRYGGDEFAIILIDSDLDIAKEIGSRIQDTLKGGNISASMGYTRFSEEMSIKDFVSEADKNLFKSKLRIRDRLPNI